MAMTSLLYNVLISIVTTIFRQNEYDISDLMYYYLIQNTFTPKLQLRAVLTLSTTVTPGIKPTPLAFNQYFDFCNVIACNVIAFFLHLNSHFTVYHSTLVLKLHPLVSLIKKALQYSRSHQYYYSNITILLM